MTQLPPIQYAKAGEVDIAYRVLGSGPFDPLQFYLKGHDEPLRSSDRVLYAYHLTALEWQHELKLNVPCFVVTIAALLSSPLTVIKS